MSEHCVECGRPIVPEETGDVSRDDGEAILACPDCCYEALEDSYRMEEQAMEESGKRKAESGKMDSIALIAAERRRQIEVEGFDALGDNMLNDGMLATAAACYATVDVHRGIYVWPELDPGIREIRLRHAWPWDWSWWKPKTRLRNLVRAGALIAAEIDRLLRADARQAREPKVVDTAGEVWRLRYVAMREAARKRLADYGSRAVADSAIEAEDERIAAENPMPDVDA